MAGLDPAIHANAEVQKRDNVDARIKSAHDDRGAGGDAFIGSTGSGEPGLATALCQGADAADIGGALGDADDAARVEQIE
jgi:hypothetical protein